MHFKALLLGVCAAALASAQSSVLTFTKVPTPITVGQAAALTYATNDTQLPVSIILRKGDANNLQTVATLTDNASGGQYIWTPSSDLVSADDYALEIKQGGEVNYFGPFSIQGGSRPHPGPPGYGSSSWGSSTASASLTGYYSSTWSSASSSTASPTSYKPITTSPSAYPIYSANSTVVTYPGTGSSYGTASTISRNTTLFSATLSASHKSTAAATITSSSTAGSGSGSSTNSGAGFQSPSTAPTNAASGLKAGSSVALVLGAIAAVFYA